VLPGTIRAYQSHPSPPSTYVVAICMPVSGKPGKTTAMFVLGRKPWNNLLQYSKSFLHHCLLAAKPFPFFLGFI